MYYTDEIMNNVYDYLQEANSFLNKANDNLRTGYRSVSENVRTGCRKREILNDNLLKNAQDIIDDFSQANENIENLSLATFDTSIFDTDNLGTFTTDEQSISSTSLTSFDGLDEETKEAIYSAINDSATLTDIQKELAKENEETLAYGYLLWLLDTEIEKADALIEGIYDIYNSIFHLDTHAGGYSDDSSLINLINDYPELAQYFQADSEGNYIYCLEGEEAVEERSHISSEQYVEESHIYFVKDREGNYRVLSEYLLEIQKDYESYKPGLRNQKYQYECLIKTLVYANIDMEVVRNTEYDINDTIQPFLNVIFNPDTCNLRIDYQNWRFPDIDEYYGAFNNEKTIPNYSVLNTLYYIYTNVGFKEYFKLNYGHYPDKKEIVEYTIGEKFLGARCFLYMTDDQYQIYNYLYVTQGEEVANDYLNSIEDEINNQMGFDKAQDLFIDVYSKNTGFEQIMSSFGYGVENGIEGFCNNIVTAFNKNVTMTVDEYAAYYLCLLYSCDLVTTEYSQEEFIQTYKNGEIEINSEVYDILCNRDSISVLDIQLASGEITKDEYVVWKELSKIPEYQELFEKTNGEGSNGLNLAFTIGSSVGNMIPSMVASLAISKIGGGAKAAVDLGKITATILSFLNSYGGNYKNNVRLGYNQTAAQLASFLSATGEVGAEYLLGKIVGIGASTNVEGMLSNLTEYTSKWLYLKDTALSMFKDIGGEIMQEIGQNGLDKMIRCVTLGEPVDLSTFPSESLETAIVTGLTTFILNAPKTIENAISGVHSINQTQSFVRNGQTIEISQETINSMQTDMINQGILRVNETGSLENSNLRKVYDYIKNSSILGIAKSASGKVLKGIFNDWLDN